jgi:hypothetical protein
MKDGRIASVDAFGARQYLPTGFPEVGAMIYSLPVEFEGKLLGSTWKTQGLFSYDLATGKIKDYGSLASGKIQIYDILPTPEGLYLASYTGGYIDLLPSLESQSIRRLAHLDKEGAQERPIQMARGTDGAIYVASMPIKAQLGGALSRVTTEGDVTVHRHIVPNQGITSIVAIPGTPLLFCTSTIQGGSSAIPSEKEARTFLWNTDSQTKVKEMRLIPETKAYHRALATDDGLVLCLGDDGSFVIWDSSKEHVKHSGRLKSSRFKAPFINPIPIWDGRHAIIYGTTTIETINLDTGASEIVLKWPEMEKCTGFYTRPNGTLYYGMGQTLYRRKLSQP